jgi:hypothetical protein
MKITENKLRNIIQESINKVLEEYNIGWSNDVWEEFDYLEQTLGAEKLVREIAGKISEYELKSILKTIKGHYGLNDDEEYDE